MRSNVRVAGVARSTVDTMPKRCPNAIASMKLASAIPTTGAIVSSRAANRPGSPKQAMIAASNVPARSETSRATAAAAIVSPYQPSMNGTLDSTVAGSISLPGRAPAQAATAIPSVIDRVVLGLMSSNRTLMRMRLRLRSAGPR